MQQRPGAALERERHGRRLERVGVLGQVHSCLTQQRRLARTLHRRHCASQDRGRNHRGPLIPKSFSSGGGRVAYGLVDEELVDLILASGELGALEDGGGPPARTVGDLRALRPRRRPAGVLRRHHHHHRVPSQLRHLHNQPTSRLKKIEKSIFQGKKKEIEKSKLCFHRRERPCLRGVELELEHGLGLATVAAAAAAAAAPFEHVGSAAHSRERHRLRKKDRIFLPLATPAEATTSSRFHRGRHCNAGSGS